MKPLKTVRLAIHPGRHSTSWSLIHRTDDGRTVFDRRLHAGTLSHLGVIHGLTDVPEVLRAIADEIERRHGVPSAPAGSGALEGGGGRLDPEPSDLPGIDPVSPRGQWVDVPLPED